VENIKELTFEELKNLLREWGEPAFCAKQIFSWIYKKGADDFDQMSNLALALRKRLKENFCLSSLKLIQASESHDGTEKFLFALQDKNLIEAVIIPAKERITGCVSTQAGCKFKCLFCASGLLGLKRNLTQGEIIEQVLYLKNKCQDEKLTNLVFMGTGEPLDNYDNVMKAIRIINSSEGLNIGARKITISTCGIIPGIERLSQEGLQIELSISLHASDDKTRNEIMPVNKKYPLNKLMFACRQYIEKTNRQITFEYILIAGLNSDLQSAKNLSKILKGLICKVNLIPANVVKECKIGPPKNKDILFFRDYLLKQGINVTLRMPRGQDIEAACGQLRLRYENK
jgi:23S rRNA (adenine2503-C2)-methyltransferase